MRVRIGELESRIQELERQLSIAQEEMERLRQNEKMDAEAGLIRKSAFLTRLQDEIRASERYGRFLTLVVLSVYPRSLSSTHHLSRDEAELLRDLGSRLHASLRETDMVSILDNHELAIMLVETEERNALRVVNRLCEETDEAMDVRWALASYPTDAPRDDLLLSIARERLLAAQSGTSGTIVSSSVILQSDGN